MVSKSDSNAARSIGKIPFLDTLLISNPLSIKYFIISKLFEDIAELTDMRILSLIFSLMLSKSKPSKTDFIILGFLPSIAQLKIKSEHL